MASFLIECSGLLSFRFPPDHRMLPEALDYSIIRSVSLDSDVGGKYDCNIST